MKKILAILIVSQFILQATAQVSFGQPEKVNQSWKFSLSDPKGAEAAGFNDNRWQTVNLPHDWSVKGQLSPTLASCTGYLPGGIAWYRKSISIPETRRGEKVYLYFEGVYNRSEVYINGKLLGKRPNGYISFMYDATPHIEYGKNNVIAVRVDHSLSADSRWYTGSGIYRDVYVVYANPVHIAQWGVFTWSTVKNNQLAEVNVEVELTNFSKQTPSLTVYNELYNKQGKMVARSARITCIAPGESRKVNTMLQVNNPELWNLENPYLYTLKTIVKEGDKVIDQSSTRTGLRTYTFDPDKGFALNGQWMKMKGVCLHHDAGVLGASSYKEVWKRRLLTLKELGVNAIRTSHNPQAPHLYELCDELGILVMNEAYDEWEFPKRKWLEGWNVGTPGFQGTYDFFAEWGEKDLEDMVKRDRNHISIFSWSIGNEVDYPNDPYSHPVLDGGRETGFTQPIFGGYRKDAPDAMRLGAIAKRLAAVVRKFDPSRPVTAGLAGVAMSNETEYPAALDICGYNYTENMYDSDHKKYPKRVIYGSENRHDLAAWKAVTSREFIFGQFLWTGIDYLGESGRWPSRGFYSGLLDFGGFIKPRGYFRQSLWAEKPMIYIGTYPTRGRTGNADVWSQLEDENEPARNPRLSMDAWPVWNYEDGRTIRVVAYTNAPQARLMLNGSQVGEAKPYDDNTGIIYWDIPYAQGALVAEGLDKEGKVISSYSIRSSKQPHALRLAESEISLCKDRKIAHVIVDIVDEDGVPVMLSDNEITCQIAGPAVLLGLEASNNSDMSDYSDNKHRAFNGRLLAYIQSDGKEGEVKVRFSSPWLQSAELTIKIR
jgi:beta-galactosidase